MKRTRPRKSARKQRALIGTIAEERRMLDDARWALANGAPVAPVRARLSQLLREYNATAERAAKLGFLVDDYEKILRGRR